MQNTFSSVCMLVVQLTLVNDFYSINDWKKFALLFFWAPRCFFIKVFGKKSVFYINLYNDSATLTAKLQKDWLHIILVKFPELIFFLIAFCDCLPFLFINFFNKKQFKTFLEPCFLLICVKK